MKFIISNILNLFFTITLFANSINKFHTGEWVVNGDAKQLFKTSNGHVYKFPIEKKFNLIYDIFGKNSEDFSSIQVDLLKNSQFKKIQRYVVLEFDCRIHLIYHKENIPFISLCLTKSASNPNNIKKTSTLQSLLFFEFPKAVSHSIAKNQQTIGMFSVMSNGNSYSTNYELNRVRIIFDLADNKYYSVNINGHKEIKYHYEKMSKLSDLRSMGICICRHSKWNEKKVKQAVIELSQPRILTTNNVDDLINLPLVETPHNIYEKYYFIDKKPENNKTNPDETYAIAMKYLNNYQFENAIDLLKKADREKHILAPYQLGLCYQYGLGVLPNKNLAKKYYERASEYDFIQAKIQYSMFLLKNYSSFYSAINSFNSINQNTKNIFKKTNSYLNYIEGSVPLENNIYQFITQKYDNNIISGITTWSNSFKLNYIKAISADFSHLYPVVKIRLKLIDDGYLPMLKWQANKFAKNQEYKNALKVLENHLDNKEIFLEYHLYSFLSGNNIEEIFSNNNELIYGQYPLYWILKILNQNNMRDMPNNIYKNLKNQENLSDEKKLLFALLSINLFYNDYAKSYLGKIYNKDIIMLQDAYNLLKKLKDSNDVAKYFLAKIYLEYAEKFDSFESKQLYFNAILLLKSIKVSNFELAHFELVKQNYLKNKNINNNDLEKLGNLVKDNFADASFLLGEYYLTIKSINKAIIYFKHSGEQGYIESFCRLADIFANNKTYQNNQEAKKYWEIYIKLLQEQRLNDINDLYIGENIKHSIYWEMHQLAPVIQPEYIKDEKLYQKY